MSVLYSLAGAVNDFMNAGPSFPVFVVAVAVVVSPLVFFHELGHAVAARRLLRVPVRMTVGNVGRVLEVRVGGVHATVNATAPPWRRGGVVEGDFSRARARDVLLIALAGPAASLLLGLLLLAWYGAAPDHGVVHALLWTAASLSLEGAILNLIPMTVQERRDRPPFRTDGRLALDALRLLGAPPPSPPQPPPDPAARSVPPPGMS